MIFIAIFDTQKTTYERNPVPRIRIPSLSIYVSTLPATLCNNKPSAMSFLKNKLSRGHSMRVPADEVCAVVISGDPLP